MTDLKPGWLERQFHANAVEIATWPESMRKTAGFSDVSLTRKQRREAAAILRKRADELEAAIEPEHCCGASGFGQSIYDECPACRKMHEEWRKKDAMREQEGNRG